MLCPTAAGAGPTHTSPPFHRRAGSSRAVLGGCAVWQRCKIAVLGRVPSGSKCQAIPKWSAVEASILNTPTPSALQAMALVQVRDQLDQYGVGQVGGSCRGVWVWAFWVWGRWVLQADAGSSSSWNELSRTLHMPPTHPPMAPPPCRRCPTSTPSAATTTCGRWCPTACLRT